MPASSAIPARVDVVHGRHRPPMTLSAASAPPLDLARAVARDQGLSQGRP